MDKYDYITEMGPSLDEHASLLDVSFTVFPLIQKLGKDLE